MGGWGEICARAVRITKKTLLPLTGSRERSYDEIYCGFSQTSKADNEYGVCGTVSISDAKLI